jgi:hypothetical protein
MKLEPQNVRAKHFYSTAKPPRKVFLKEKNELQIMDTPILSHVPSLIDDSADAMLDSDSDGRIDSQMQHQSNPVNTNLTEQAVVSIYTIDDDNPLSENGDRDSCKFRDGLSRSSMQQS